MRLRVAVCVVAATVAVVATSVVVTGVRSNADERTAAIATPAVSLARASDTYRAGDGATITVPGLVDSAAASASQAAQSQAAQSQAIGRSRAVASRSSASVAAAEVAASQAAAAKAAADKAAADKAAADKAAADKAAADKAAASSAAASSAAASSAAVSSAAASSAAASSATASSAAVSSAAASSSSAASSAAASRSAAAQSVSAAANPAPDTSDAVQVAVEQAGNAGITQSVVVMNRQTGSVTTSVDADTEMPSMSLVKLILAADVIDRAGGVPNVPSDTLDRLHRMIAVSDDSIAQDFYDDGGQGAIITRVATAYGLSETSPSPQARYWGDVRITARDMASFLYQLLSNPDTSMWFTEAMEDSQAFGADGFYQNFGVNSIIGAGSKQGWGCCLGSVLTIHSMGFTPNQIIVVMSTAHHDKPDTQLDTAVELSDDAGVQASVAAVTRTVDAALPVP